MPQMTLGAGAAENVVINARYDWASHGWHLTISARLSGQDWPQKGTSFYGPLTSDEMMSVVVDSLEVITKA